MGFFLNKLVDLFLADDESFILFEHILLKYCVLCVVGGWSFNEVVVDVGDVGEDVDGVDGADVDGVDGADVDGVDVDGVSEEDNESDWDDGIESDGDDGVGVVGVVEFELSFDPFIASLALLVIGFLGISISKEKSSFSSIKVSIYFFFWVSSSKEAGIGEEGGRSYGRPYLTQIKGFNVPLKWPFDLTSGLFSGPKYSSGVRRRELNFKTVGSVESSNESVLFSKISDCVELFVGDEDEKRGDDLIGYRIVEEEEEDERFSTRE